MTTRDPIVEFDGRFSDPQAEATPWEAAERVLAQAELYWLTTVRRDGRPHVTPLVGVWHDGAFHFCTGFGEQKELNLQGNRQVAVTTGQNTWAAGTDVVVEGAAVRVTEPSRLQALADAYRTKYGSDWDFGVGDGVFESGGNPAIVLRVEPDKALSFGKAPHAQTRYRWAGHASPE
ncbi:MAG: pyridoxamine 5'-phosphate oxidase family protein [Jiangellaceae bacterium]